MVLNQLNYCNQAAYKIINNNQLNLYIECDNKQVF